MNNTHNYVVYNYECFFARYLITNFDKLYIFTLGTTVIK